MVLKFYFKAIFTLNPQLVSVVLKIYFKTIFIDCDCKLKTYLVNVVLKFTLKPYSANTILDVVISRILRVSG